MGLILSGHAQEMEVACKELFGELEDHPKVM
jgi:hypothetical protein